MPRYNSIQPVVFQLLDAEQPLRIVMPTMAFPATWKTTLHELQSAQSGRDPAVSRLKISTLNKALRALVPDLISIAPNADKQDVRHWLTGRQSIDERAIHRIMTEWVRAEYPNVDQAARRSALESMRPSDLQWQEQTFDVGSWGVADNGTAVPKSGESFVLLPDLLAAQLSQSGVSFQLGADRLQFRRVPLSPGGQGAQLVSWPPLRFTEKRGRTWYFSVLITLTVQTVPFQAFPVIHCDLGLRRWASQPVTYMPAGDETSVFLLTQVPWLEDVPLSTSFQVAPMRWTRSSTGRGPGQYVWGSNLAPILNALVSSRRSFADPEMIRADPVAALNLSGDWHAALAYRNGIRPDHAVSAGIMPAKRRELTEQIVAQLKSLVVLSDSLPKCYPTRSFSITVSRNPFDERSAEAVGPWSTEDARLRDRRFHVAPSVHAERRAAIAKAIGNELPIEIYFQTSDVRNALIQVLEGLLGVTIGESFPTTINTPELRLIVRVCALGGLGAPLSIPATGGSFRDRLQTAIRTRIDAIAAQVPSETGPVAAFIELQGEDHFQGADDPKHAIRAGFAQVNRLTQFLGVGNDARLPHRAINGVLDMFRQLGVVVGLPLPERIGPHRLALVGLWLVNRQRESSPSRVQQALPVLVHIDTETLQVKAHAPGLPGWLPYPQALLALSKAAVRGEIQAFQRPRDALRFIRPTIEREFAGMGETLLLAHAQNARRAWPWLANNRLSVDTLTFGEEPPQSLRRWRGLRVIRIRDSQSYETPEWYAQSEADTGFTRGLFVMGERVFASTHDKPLQFQKARRGGELEELAWNPAIIELTVAALQPGDQFQPWAAYTHELRQALIHYEGATVLPLPLHLAEAASEYSVALDAPDDADDEE